MNEEKFSGNSIYSTDRDPIVFKPEKILKDAKKLAVKELKIELSVVRREIKDLEKTLEKLIIKRSKIINKLDELDV